MSDDFQKLDVIAVGAHPDDVEIACGGTLAKLVQQGYQVGIIDLTDGEPTPGCPDPKIRIEEAAAAAEALGVQFRQTLELPNRKLFDSFEARCQLATAFRKHRPRIVIGFGEKTPMASPDHWQAMQITDAAIFYSRLTKWNDHFDGTEPHKIEAQVYFHLSWEPVANDQGYSRFIVDISDTLSNKMASVRCYETQFPPEKQTVFARVEALAQQIGTSRNYDAGELFFTPRTLGTADFVKTVLPQ